MKIIYILSHSYKGRLPSPEEVHRVDTLGHRYALKTRQYNRGYEIECWWPERQLSRPVTITREGVTFRAFPASSYRFPYKHVSLPLVRALNKEVQKNRVLVFIHGLEGRWTTILPLFIKGCPFVVHQHNDGSFSSYYSRKKLMRHPWLTLLMPLERWAYRHIDHFFLLSKGAKEEMERYVAPERISVQTSGVDFDLFRPMQKAEARGQLGLQPENQYILYVGRIERKKGINYLFEALPSIVKEFSRTVLLVVGNAPRRHFLNQQKELLVRLGMQDRVRFLGVVRNDRLPGYYNAADLLVLPSLAEGVPHVLMEAAACECPFISTQVGGIPEFAKSVGYGKLVPPADSEAIAGAVKEVLGEPSRFRGERERARMYSWDCIMGRIFEIFEELQQKHFSQNGYERPSYLHGYP